MFAHYFKTLYRNLRRNPGFSLLNLLGLTIGMTACLLILRYVSMERSYDRFHANADHLYRVSGKVFSEGEWEEMDIYTSYALGPALDSTMPEVVKMARAHPWYESGVVSFMDEEGREQSFFEKEGLFVDPAFLEMFNFPLVMGDPHTALKDRKTMLLSETMAKRYFGSPTTAMGKTVEINGSGVSDKFQVTGILKDLPSNTHLPFQFLLPMEDKLATNQYTQDDGWGWFNFLTYLQLNPQTDTTQFAPKAEMAVKPVLGEDYAEPSRFVPTLYPVVNIHLYSEAAEEISPSGNAQSVSFFVLIAILILTIAWINYINLSTARSLERSREVGVRKVVGAQRGQLIRQFLFESFAINLLAFGLAIILAHFTLPLLSDLVGKDLSQTYQDNRPLYFLFTGGILMGALISGLYPAVLLSAFQPTTVLKGLGKKRVGGISLRKSLVVVQFALAVALIAGTLAVYRQISFMQGQELGMNLDQILVVKGPRIFPEGTKRAPKVKAFKTEVKSLAQVIDVSGAGSIPGGGYNWGTNMRKVGQPASENEDVFITFVDSNFINTYGMELLAGSNFTPTGGGAIINEATLRLCEMGDPQAALQEQLWISGDTIPVLGVLKDYGWNSMRNAHVPFILGPSLDAATNLCIKLRAENMGESLASIEAKYREIFPGNPFDYHFQDEFFARQYQEDQQFGSMFGIFTLLAIIVACLGLLGLASYSAVQRTKEIGIRKVVGASVGQLVVLLSQNYLFLVGIALVLGLPLAWWMTSQWLQDFPFRVSLGIWFFIFPALGVLLVALLTIIWKTFRTAQSNPVKALRYE